MKVAILDDYQRAAESMRCFSLLAAHDVTVFNDTLKDEAALAARLAPFEAIVLIRERTRVTASLLARLPALKLIAQTAKAGAHIDLAACAARGVTVCEGSGGPVSTAELTWALILAAERNLLAESAAFRAGLWQRTVGVGLAGRRLGLLGFGRIAQRVARYAQAFEMDLLVWGRESTRAKAAAAGVPIATSMLELFEQSDIVSVQLRLTSETRGIVTLEALQSMGADALFVNTSRAELVAPGALEAALASGRPGRAALDVHENEPLVGAVPAYLCAPGVTATPHVGFVERRNYEHYFEQAFVAVNAYAGGAPVGVVK